MIIPEELRILRYEELSIGQMVYIKSRATHLLYKCEIIKLSKNTFSDMLIKLTDDEYRRYRGDGAFTLQSWHRNFDRSKLYLNNDQNDISFWRGQVV